MAKLDHNRAELQATDGSEPSRSKMPAHLKIALSAGLGVTVLLVGLFVFLATQKNDQLNASPPIRVSGLPAGVTTRTAYLMSLSPVQAIPANPFTLTDQNGRTVSLTSFKGRVVVLNFMDPHCTDICPIISQELIDAYHDLGVLARTVVFLAVNVNRFHTSVAAIKSFTDEHGLNTLPSWHFLTGTPSVLKSIWAEYGVSVVAPSRSADIIHSSLILFIDRSGRKRYLASPTDFHTKTGKSYLPVGSLTQWGKGIAEVTKSLLP